jgi:flagellar biosynthesis anti-sigma factor FlgM
MRIDLNPGNAVPDSKLERNAEAHAPSTAAEHETRFSVSQSSVSRLAAVALNAPETRTQKVEELRSQIQTGTYHVSPDQLAGSVLEHMRVTEARPKGGV